MPPPDAPPVPDRRPPAVLPRERFPYPTRLVLTALGLAALLALLPPHGFGTVLWVIGIYLVIEMIDDHIILPLLNWRTIWLPPALAIFSQVVLAALWGGLAVVLAMPLVAVVMVLVKILYVHGTLGEPIELGRSTVAASTPSGVANGRQAES